MFSDDNLGEWWCGGVVVVMCRCSGLPFFCKRGSHPCSSRVYACSVSMYVMSVFLSVCWCLPAPFPFLPFQIFKFATRPAERRPTSGKAQHHNVRVFHGKQLLALKYWVGSNYKTKRSIGGVCVSWWMMTMMATTMTVTMAMAMGMTMVKWQG